MRGFCSCRSTPVVLSTFGMMRLVYAHTFACGMLTCCDEVISCTVFCHACVRVLECDARTCTVSVACTHSRIRSCIPDFGYFTASEFSVRTEQTSLWPFGSSHFVVGPHPTHSHPHSCLYGSGASVSDHAPIPLYRFLFLLNQLNPKPNGSSHARAGARTNRATWRRNRRNEE